MVVGGGSAPPPRARSPVSTPLTTPTLAPDPPPSQAAGTKGELVFVTASGVEAVPQVQKRMGRWALIGIVADRGRKQEQYVDAYVQGGAAGWQCLSDQHPLASGQLQLLSRAHVVRADAAVVHKDAPP